MAKRNDRPTTEQDEPTTENRVVNRRRVLQVAGAGLLGTGAMAAGAVAEESPDRLEIYGSGSEPVNYTFTVDGTVTPVTESSFIASESDEESVSENDDGTVTVTGKVKANYGDTFDIAGDVISFQPKTGRYRLFLNGNKISRSELISEPSHRLEITTPADGSVEYTMTTTGEITKLYTDDKRSAEKKNDVVVQNDDDTWTITGLTGNGYGDSFEFAGDVLDFSPMQGSFTLYLDGEEVTPHELTGEERLYDRNHSYSFEATGDSWADYYLEVADEGKMVASTLEGATVDPDFHWVSDDGTKAAGRIHPGDRHAYEFDSLVLDVTIEGDADAFVNGSPSNLYIYPQSGATGDGWKSGFPWQDEVEQQQEEEEEQTTTGVGIRHSEYQGSLGGGDGMESSQVYSASSADTVVGSMGELQDAVDSASSGDVIYVEGSIWGHLDVRTPGVTIAGNRGVGSDGVWSDASMEQNAADVRLDGLSIDAGGSEFCAVNDTGLEVFNCLVENADDGDGAFGWNTGDTGALFSHSTFQNFGYYGLQVRYNWHSESDKITIQYCEFNDLGQHMVQGGQGWFHLKDNHFRGTLNHSTDHIIEVRGEGGAPVPCGADSGNAIVEHNLHEAHGSSGAKSGLVRVRGVPTDGVWVRNNDAPGNGASTGGCHDNGSHGGWGDQLVMQNASGSDSFENVTIENNER